jgi:hypothetical protein
MVLSESGYSKDAELQAFVPQYHTPKYFSGQIGQEGLKRIEARGWLVDQKRAEGRFEARMSIRSDTLMIFC